MSPRLLLLALLLGPASLRCNPAAASDVSAPELPPCPLTLPAALAFAAEHNPALREVREQIKEQDGVLLQVRALRQPSLDLTSRYDQIRQALVQIPGYVNETWQVKLSAVQVLYAGGALRAGSRAQAEQVEIAKLTYLAREQDVFLSVQESFYSVLLDRELIAVQEEAVKVLEAELADAQRRHAAGLGSQFDVIRAEATLANAQPALIQARNRHRVGQDRLSRLLGAPPARQERPDLGVEGQFFVSEHTIPLADALQAARGKRVEIARQKHAIAAAEQGVVISRSGRYPTVSAHAGYEYTGDYTSLRFRDSVPGWSFGLQSDWAIFDGHARAGRTAQARSRCRQAQIAAEDLLLDIDLEVRENHASRVEADQLLLAATQTVAEAEESLRLAQASKQEGMATQLDVLTAQSALTEARSTLSNARFRCSVAQARLNRAMGDDPLPPSPAR